MATILDSAIVVAQETAYGTSVSATATNKWLALEAQADTWKRSQEYLESVGMRGALQTTPSDRRKTITMGGEGSLTFDVSDRGFGKVLEALLGAQPASAAATVSGWAWSVSTSAALPMSASYTIQVQRPDVNGTVYAYDHAGSVLTEWTLKNDVGSLLNFDAKFVCSTISSGTSAAASIVPVSGAVPIPSSTAASAASTVYDWTQCKVYWGGNPIDAKSMQFDAKLGLKTDRRYLRGSGAIKQPIRNSVPEFTGSVEIDWDMAGSATSGIYADYVAGTTREMRFEWTSSIAISGTQYRTLVIKLPKVQFSGGDPEVSLSDLPKQALPFKVLWDPTVASEAVRITYTTIDTTL